MAALAPALAPRGSGPRPERRVVWRRASSRRFATSALLPSARARVASASSDSSSVVSDPAGELVLVVGGAGRVGSRLVSRLAASGVRVRVLTRDPTSDAARALADRHGGDSVEIARGDVADEDPTELVEAVRGCTRVVACFGAQRVTSPLADAFARPGPHVTDPAHPAAVNFRGVARLAKIAADAGTVRRFVRVTGMSVGYHPANFIAVALNLVLSMTIRWQRAGENALRETAEASRRSPSSPVMEYACVRPGNLLDGPRPPGSTVLIGHGRSHVPAGKVARDDVAECVFLCAFAPNCADATVGVAGAAVATGGVRAEMAWDPARGMHYRATEMDPRVLEGTDVAEMVLTGVEPDAEDERILEKTVPYEPFVAALAFLLAGVAAAIAKGAWATLRFAAGYFVGGA